VTSGEEYDLVDILLTSRKLSIKIIFQFPTDDLHDEFELLTVKEITEQEILTFVHNFFTNNLPPVFDGYFETNESNHNRNTRNGKKMLFIPRHTTHITESSIKILGAKLWNKLDNLKNVPKAKKFKYKYKYSCFPYIKSS